MRVGIPGLKIILTIETGCFDKGIAPFDSRGQQNKISRNEFSLLDPHNISDDDFTPLDCYKITPSEYPCCHLKIQLLVRFVSLIVFIAYIEAALPYRSIEIARTKIKGPQAVKGPSGLI